MKSMRIFGIVFVVFVISISQPAMAQAPVNSQTVTVAAGASIINQQIVTSGKPRDSQQSSSVTLSKCVRNMLFSVTCNTPYTVTYSAIFLPNCAAPILIGYPNSDIATMKQSHYIVPTPLPAGTRVQHVIQTAQAADRCVFTMLGEYCQQ